jgi:simple sugar transport system substrate-binding protein
MSDNTKDVGLSRRNILLGGAAAPALLVAPLFMAAATTEAAAEDGKKYVFYHILWDMTDANVQFHIRAGDVYMAAHPGVEIKYVGPEKYDPAEHAKFLDTVVNAKPDGITMHISSVDALLPGMMAAEAAGIPFVSVTGHPPSPDDEAKIKGHYLTWVGADEQYVGGVMGERLLKDVPAPRRVAYFMAHLGHAAQEQRAAGFFASMPSGVPGDKVAIGEEPQKAKDIIRSYITANPDVDAIFETPLADKWTTDVLEEMGRTDVKVLTADEAPSSIEGILAGKILASFGQQFPIQAPFAYDILLHFNENKMAPVTPIVTGPAVIDSSNAAAIGEIVKGILGEDTYYKLSPF